MSNLECKTEETIKQLAKELFFSKGCFNASTQEIADFAGVNRTLVNYYFRSKAQLFEVVYWEVVTEMRTKLAEIYLSKADFRSKVEMIIDYLSAFRHEYPFLEVFNIQETVKLSNKVESIVNPVLHTELVSFFREIEEQMELGVIRKCDPRNFFVNLASLVSYPIVMAPLFGKILDLDQEEYQKILVGQKEAIMNLIFTKTN